MQVRITARPGEVEHILSTLREGFTLARVSHPYAAAARGVVRVYAALGPLPTGPEPAPAVPGDPEPAPPRRRRPWKAGRR